MQACLVALHLASDWRGKIVALTRGLTGEHGLSGLLLPRGYWGEVQPMAPPLVQRQ